MRSKTVPTAERSQESVPLSWSLVARIPAQEDSLRYSSSPIKLPKIRRVSLNEV